MPSVADPARVADRVKFLSRVPPFKSLSEDELREVAGTVRERAVAAGEAVLVEGGPPGEELYVVRLGTLELIHKDAYVAIVPAGEVLGHPTLLTGLAPEFTVRAREDSLLYCLPRAAAMKLLTHPAGVTWMAANARERLLQAAGTMRALPDVRTLPVTSVVRSKPLFCDPETPVAGGREDHDRREALGDPGARPGRQGHPGHRHRRRPAQQGRRRPRLAARAGHRDHVGAGAHHRRRGAGARGQHRHDGRRA